MDGWTNKYIINHMHFDGAQPTVSRLTIATHSWAFFVQSSVRKHAKMQLGRNGRNASKVVGSVCC